MKRPVRRQIATPILSATLLLLALFPTRLAASSLTLAWSSNTENDLAGYKVYYGTLSRDYDSVIDVGNVTQYTVGGLQPETKYYLALTAYDTSRNESDFSGEVSGVTDASITPTPDGGGGGCFIATAAYGSYLNPHVKILRDFRDKYLIPNLLGRKFVNLYYRYGPHIADHTEEYNFLRFLTRQTLLPLIGVSAFSLQTTVSSTLLLLLLFISLIFILSSRSHQPR